MSSARRNAKSVEQGRWKSCNGSQHSVDIKRGGHIMFTTPDEIEQYRNECEARWVLTLPNIDARRSYLQRVEKRRGKPAADYLKNEVLNQWQRKSTTSQ